MVRQKTDYHKNIPYVLILLCADILSYFAALFLAYYTRTGIDNFFPIRDFEHSLADVISQSWWISILLVLVLSAFGLYSSRLPFWTEARQLLKACATVFILLFSIVFIVKLSEYVSRLTIVLLWFYTSICLLSFRYFVKNFFYKYSFFSSKAIIVGGYEEAAGASKSFSREKYIGFNIAGLVLYQDDVKKFAEKDLHVNTLGKFEDIQKIIEKENIDVVIFMPSMENLKNLTELIGQLQIIVSKVIMVPSSNWLALSNADTVQTFLTRLSYFQINNNLKSLTNRFIKRTMDLFLCLLALPFLAVITLVIGALIKLTSEGNVFYRQMRVGRYGKTIGVLKFRSMYKDADKRLKEILETDENARKEWEAGFKLKNDPRVTKIGSFLRKTSLDELPQIFNVIAGDMSLIGPRPVLQKELDVYYKDFANYYLMMRPGITGLWQISGRSDSTYEFRVARDAWYVLNWSVWLDIVILIKTPAVVLKKEGAY